MFIKKAYENRLKKDVSKIHKKIDLNNYFFLKKG